MKAIRFLVNCEGKGTDWRAFTEGSAHLLNDASAWHWVKRDKAEFIEHTPTPALPPDPVVPAAGTVPEEPPTRTEATLAKVEEKMANPPSVLAPLIEKADGNAVGSSTDAVEKPDSVDPGVGAKPAVMPAGNPATGGRPSNRSGSNK